MKSLSGDLSWLGHIFLNYENALNPFEVRRRTIELWKEIAVVDCNANEELIKTAEIIELQGIKAKDALHIACALYTKCDYFLTTDNKLLKRTIRNIKIVSPIEFVERLENDEL